MSEKRKKPLLPVLALAMLLTGCATPLPSATPPKKPPPAPELMQEPDLSETYSDGVRKLLLDWQRRLTDWKRSS